MNLYESLKRALDVLLAVVALLVCSPLLLATAVIVWFDSGRPILYCSVRVGRNGRPFNMFKFRTMRDGPDAAGLRVTAADDPRVTSLGRILRATKLNELPQLVNVLKGDMSLVGPRPEDPEFVAHYSEQERAILSVRPGITSPASLLFFEEEKLLKAATAGEAYVGEIMPTKLRLDLQYVEERSLLLDLDILLGTLLAMLPKLNWRASGMHDMLAGPIQRLSRRYASWFAADAIASLVAIAIAGAAWRSVGPLDVGWGPALLHAAGFAGVFALVNSFTGVQRTWWRYAGTRDALDLALSGVLSTTVILVVNVWVFPGNRMPMRVLASACTLALAAFFGLRYWRRIGAGLLSMRQRLNAESTTPGERVLVVGAGEAAQSVVRSILRSPASRVLKIVGFVDDDVWKQGERIHGLSVLGSCADLPRVCHELGVGLILFAIHRIAPEQRAALLAACRATGARVVLVPDVLGRVESAVVDPLVAEAKLRRPRAGGGQWASGPTLDRDLVVSWLSEIEWLVTQGRYNTLQRRVHDLRASIVEPGDGPQEAASGSVQAAVAPAQE